MIFGFIVTVLKIYDIWFYSYCLKKKIYGFGLFKREIKSSKP